jgi:hypothetical protein
MRSIPSTVRMPSFYRRAAILGGMDIGPIIMNAAKSGLIAGVIGGFFGGILGAIRAMKKRQPPPDDPPA